MDLSGIAKGALLVLGAGILAERFGAGPGLAGLGAGVREMAAAPLGGLGAGMGEFAGGLRSIGESFGDIGRGIADIFAAIPTGPITGIPWSPIAEISPKAGNDATQLAVGGGGNVPKTGGVYYVGTVGGGGYTFPGAKTIWVKESAAIKNYRAAQGTGGNNV